MNRPTRCFYFAIALLSAFSTACAGTDLFKEKVVETPEMKLEKHWEFDLSFPVWLPGLYGDVGVKNIVNEVDVPFHSIFNKIDMFFTMEGEVRKGRFGLRGSLYYYSISDSVGRENLVRKVDVRADEYVAELSFGYRLIEGEKGWLDLRAGVRYINLYDRVGLQPNSAAIQSASERIVATPVNKVGEAIRDEIGNALDGDFDFPVPPLTADQKLMLIKVLVAIRNDPKLLADLKSGVQSRIDAAIDSATREVESTLERQLSKTSTVAEDWFDPIIGIEGRYDFNRIFYVTVRGDIGGFGVGSDLTWQAQGALGANITKNIYAEAGYRALGIDYENNGFVYDTILRGAQVTVGVRF